MESVPTCAGGTPASSMSSSSIFRPRAASPPILGHAPCLLTSSGLVSKLSEDRFASRPLAPAQGQGFATSFSATAPHGHVTAGRQHDASLAPSLKQTNWTDYVDDEESVHPAAQTGPSDGRYMQQDHHAHSQAWLQPNAHNRSSEAPDTYATPSQFGACQGGFRLFGEAPLGKMTGEACSVLYHAYVACHPCCTMHSGMSGV